MPGSRTSAIIAQKFQFSEITMFADCKSDVKLLSQPSGNEGKYFVE
jgi:hypothetical protein